MGKCTDISVRVIYYLWKFLLFLFVHYRYYQSLFLQWILPSFSFSLTPSPIPPHHILLIGDIVSTGFGDLNPLSSRFSLSRLGLLNHLEAKINESKNIKQRWNLVNMRGMKGKGKRGMKLEEMYRRRGEVIQYVQNHFSTGSPTSSSSPPSSLPHLDCILVVSLFNRHEILSALPEHYFSKEEIIAKCLEFGKKYFDFARNMAMEISPNVKIMISTPMIPNIYYKNKNTKGKGKEQEESNGQSGEREIKDYDDDDDIKNNNINSRAKPYSSEEKKLISVNHNNNQPSDSKDNENDPQNSITSATVSADDIEDWWSEGQIQCRMHIINEIIKYENEWKVKYSSTSPPPQCNISLILDPFSYQKQFGPPSNYRYFPYSSLVSYLIPSRFPSPPLLSPSSEGYLLLSRHLSLSLIPILQKIEWQWFSDKMNGNEEYHRRQLRYYRKSPARRGNGRRRIANEGDAEGETNVSEMEEKEKEPSEEFHDVDMNQ